MPQPDLRPVKIKKSWWQFWRLNWEYELSMDYRIYFTLGRQDYCWLIRKGARVNGASFSRFWFGRDGLHREAVFFHDLMHQCDGNPEGLEAYFMGDWKATFKEFSRNEMNQVFRQLMEIKDVEGITVAYRAVQITDWIWWKGKGR